jgi:hypothetical protein
MAAIARVETNARFSAFMMFTPSQGGLIGQSAHGFDRPLR